MKRNILVSLFIISLFSCVENFDLKLRDAESKLVVEGLITNQAGSYYVRLTKSTPGGLSSNTNSRNHEDNAESVKNAVVIIADDFNQIDTLTQFDFDISDPDYLWGPHNQGFYKTNQLIGIPGHTYTLTIKYDGKEYRASSFMAPVPKIDSLSYYLKKTEIVGKSDYYVPLLYFKEPQDIDNYYLIQLSKDINSRIYSSSVLWQFSILSDDLLKPYVNGLNVSTGVTPREINIYPVYSKGDSIYVALNSLSEEAFNYYKALLDQFNSDGGYYNSTPATPPGNISNGGLGFFRASAVSENRTYIK